MASLTVDGRYAPKSDEPEVSPADRLVDAVSRLRKVQEAASNLADRLVGAQPQEVARDTEAKGLGNGGFFDTIERAINNLNAIAHDVEASLHRVNNRF